MWLGLQPPSSPHLASIRYLTTCLYMYASYTFWVLTTPPWEGWVKMNGMQ